MFDVPDELSIGFKHPGIINQLLRNSKITDEMTLEWGSELKERVAKRHGL